MLFSPMTFFTGCPKTSLTLRSSAKRAREKDALEDDGCARATGEVCGGSVSAEKMLAELCREFGISRPVGYEWLKRYRQGGVAAIAEGSRRPSTVRGEPTRRSSSEWWSYGSAIRTGGHASCECCCSVRESNWGGIRFIAFCCGMTWCSR